jgi:hypothetical protein
MHSCPNQNLIITELNVKINLNVFSQLLTLYCTLDNTILPLMNSACLSEKLLLAFTSTFSLVGSAVFSLRWKLIFKYNSHDLPQWVNIK